MTRSLRVRGLRRGAAAPASSRVDRRRPACGRWPRRRRRRRPLSAGGQRRRRASSWPRGREPTIWSCSRASPASLLDAVAGSCATSASSCGCVVGRARRSRARSCSCDACRAACARPASARPSHACSATAVLLCQFGWPRAGRSAPPATCAGRRSVLARRAGRATGCRRRAPATVDGAEPEQRRPAVRPKILARMLTVGGTSAGAGRRGACGAGVAGAMRTAQGAVRACAVPLARELPGARRNAAPSGRVVSAIQRVANAAEQNVRRHSPTVRTCRRTNCRRARNRSAAHVRHGRVRRPAATGCRPLGG